MRERYLLNGVGLAVLLVAAVALSGGCERDVRLAGKSIRSPEVRAVTYYGITLDKSATPKQVAYVALRSIRDDFLAANEAEREAALDKLFDVCAANEIQARNRTQLSRDEFVHGVVLRWTPTVSYYVHDFETDWEKAEARLVQRGAGGVTEIPGGATECEVLMQVADPGGDPKASVVMIVWLAKDNGFWRVLHLGFDPMTRSLGGTGAAEGS